MNKKMKYLPINWTDGVKISADHFFKNYNNIIETIKDYNVIGLKKNNKVNTLWHLWLMPFKNESTSKKNFQNQNNVKRASPLNAYFTSN